MQSSCHSSTTAERYSKRPLPIEWTSASKSAEPKKLGFLKPLKHAPAASSCCDLKYCCPSPFSLSPTATVYHSSTKSYQTNYLCVTVIRRDYICSSVVSCHTSSRPLPLGWPPESRARLCTIQINCMHAFFFCQLCHKRQNCSRKPGQMSVDVTPRAVTQHGERTVWHLGRGVLMKPTASKLEVRGIE